MAFMKKDLFTGMLGEIIKIIKDNFEDLLNKTKRSNV